MEIYKAIKYIRLSYTEDKTVESDSVGNQRRMIDDFIAKHPEIEAVAEKIDDGYSGVLFDRPAFTDMIEMVKRGEANCIIVKDLSRLGRESIETGRYIRRFFPAYNVRFIAINDHFDTLQEDGDDLTVSVKNIMNEAYSRDISIKTRSALEAKRKNGDYVGAFPIYGYIKTGHQHKKLEIDPFAANVVKEIFRKRLEGYSALHIAEELNQMGVLSPMAYKKAEGQPYAKGGYGDQKDCKWSATTVLRILQDETYTGTLVQGRESTPHFKIKVRQAKPSSEWLRVENAHEAIVSCHDFDLVQRLKNIDTRTSPKLDAAYIFSGVLICGCCGGKTDPDPRERAMRCRDCGRVFYPRINPAVIVGVTNGDRLLLTYYARNRGVQKIPALIAGFTEIGETFEECVAREVMEEVGLKVKNIRYYKSQPWGIADDILAGYYCDVDGDDTIHIDESELRKAEWVRREDITGQPRPGSMTHEMMMMFKEGKE